MPEDALGCRDGDAYGVAKLALGRSAAVSTGSGVNCVVGVWVAVSVQRGVFESGFSNGLGFAGVCGLDVTFPKFAFFIQRPILDIR